MPLRVQCAFWPWWDRAVLQVLAPSFQRVALNSVSYSSRWVIRLQSAIHAAKGRDPLIIEQEVRAGREVADGIQLSAVPEDTGSNRSLLRIKESTG